MNAATPVLRRKRSKSAPDSLAELVPGPEEPSEPSAKCKEIPDETPLELLRPRTPPSTSHLPPPEGPEGPEGFEAFEGFEGSPSLETLEGTNIFVHRSDRGSWVITPLGASNIELRPRSDGLPPPGCQGVIWRLDESVLSEFQEEPDEDFLVSQKSSARHVARRLEKVSTGMRRLRAVTEKLEEKFLRFQEEKLELEKRQRHLNKSLEDSAKDRAELAQMRRKIEAEQKKFLEEKSQFEEEVRKKTDELAQSKRALSTGHFAVLPPHVLFLAAQDEFVRAVPELNVADKASLHGISQKPEAAFSSACSLFFNGGTGLDAADALVSALLACQCMLDAQAPRSFQNLEQLVGLAQAVARGANVDGRLRLSFAASSCALWCSLQVSEFLARRWDEVNSESQDLLEEDFGLMYKRIKLLSQAGSALKRSQKSLGDYWDHRRRFIRCLAKPGSGAASEADLRLLFLPFRDVKGTELAAHVRRLSGAVEDLVVESRKRTVVNLEAPVEMKRPKPSSRL